MAGIKDGKLKNGSDSTLLNAVRALPYHLCAGRCQWCEPPQAARNPRPGPMAGGLLNQSLNGGLSYA
jgi:hypothetical protein